MGFSARPGTAASGFSSSSEVTLTEIGLRVLHGKGDHVRLNGIERWLGGVRLAGAGYVLLLPL